MPRKPAKRTTKARESWVIEKQDCFKFLANIEKGTVDLVLTDPPYAISRKTGFQAPSKNGVERLAVSMEFGKWDNQEIDLSRLAKALHLVLRTGGTAIIWYDLWKLSYLADAMREAGFKMIRLITWEKTNPVPLNQRATYLSNSREIAVCGVKGGKPTFHSRYDNGVYSSPIPRHNGSRIHPTQKPVDLFAELICKHSNPGDLVIDPFLGSGTTAIAAYQEGRNFQGCDANTAYANAAERRMKRYARKEGQARIQGGQSALALR